MKHDLDMVLVEGLGQVTRRQAREEVVRRSLQTGQLVYEDRLPVGFMELTAAFHVAAHGPAFKPYIAPDVPWPLSFFD